MLFVWFLKFQFYRVDSCCLSSVVKFSFRLCIYVWVNTGFGEATDWSMMVNMLTVFYLWWNIHTHICFLYCYCSWRTMKKIIIFLPLNLYSFLFFNCFFLRWHKIVLFSFILLILKKIFTGFYFNWTIIKYFLNVQWISYIEDSISTNNFLDSL